MTDSDFEIRLARSLRRRAENSVEPFDAGRIADAAISASRPRPGFLRMALVAAAIVALALVGTVGAVFVGELLNPRPTPPVLPSPQPETTPSPEAPLGGGLILVYQPHEPRGPCESRLSDAPFDLFSLDAGTGAQTLLGTTSEDCSARHLTLQWAPDREHVLMTDELGKESLTLDTPTSAAGDLTFICCDLPTDVWQGGAGTYTGWLLSAAGDRVAAIHTRSEGTTGISDGIVVANIDGSGVVALTLPAGAAIRGWASWSPDQSALVVAACLPCNDAVEPGQPATAENHEHLYIVPVDGSPVRELLDETTGWLWTPAWSPDASTFATVRNECASGEAPPQCSGEVTSSLIVVAAEDGTDRVLVTNEQVGEGLMTFRLPAWSRDGGRIAFSAFSANADASHVFVVNADGTNLADLGNGNVLQWSPDGEWLLVGREDAPGALFTDVWIMRADGSDARSLGTFPSWFMALAW
jgi:Tol biopolymer transport system component